MCRGSLSFLFAFLTAISAFADVLGQSQAKLPTISLELSDHKLVAEVADDEAEREAGLMFRKSVTDGEGMVFVFDSPRQVAFWMKNTLIPLSVAYINRNGMILEIHDLQPEDETPVGSKFDSVVYAIEVPQGWFQKNSILPGTMVEGLPAPRPRP